MKQIQFEKETYLKSYLLRWMHSCPKLLVQEVYSSREGLDFCLENKVYSEYESSLFIENGIEVVDINEKPKNFVKSPLWSLYQLDEYTKNPEILYVILYENFLRDFLLAAFKLECFDIEMLKLDEGEVLLKVTDCTQYLFYSAQESYGAKVFWKDDYDTFMPWKKFHPCSIIWSRDSQIRFIVDRSILSVQDLNFESVFKVIDWDFSFQSIHLEAIEELPQIKISISLKKSKNFEKPSPLVCFYPKSRLPELEKWITEMSPEERRSFTILAAQTPIEGFFVKLKHWESNKSSSFLASDFAYYLPYEDYSMYCPIDDKLFPSLPRSEFDRLFPITYGETIILWNKEDSCTKVFLSEQDFKELDSIVHYVLAENSTVIERFMSNIRLDDYRIGVYDFNPDDPGQFFQEENLIQFDTVDAEDDQEIDLENIMESMDDSEKDLERDAIEKRILEIREQLMNSPKEIQLKNWFELAGLEAKLSNFNESYKLYEIVLYYSLSSENYKLCLGSIASLILKDMDHNLKVDDLVNINLEAMSNENFEYYGYLLTNDFANLSSDTARFVQTEFLLEFESRISSMGLIRLINLGSLFHKSFGLDSYLMLKVKDEFLAKLFDANIHELASLPKFIEEYKFDTEQGTSEETVNDFFDSLVGYFSDETMDVVQNKIFYHLIFSMGFAKSKNTDGASKNLSQSKNLVAYTNDSIHALFYLYYKKEIDKELYSVDNQKIDEKINEIRDQLSSTEKYKAQRLIELSRIVEPDVSIATNEMYHEYIGLSQRSPEDLLQAIPTVLSQLEVDKKTPVDRLSYKKKLAYVTILDLLPKLGQDFCLKVFDDIYSAYPTLVANDHKGSVLARLLSIACFYENDEMLQSLFEDFEALLVSIDSNKSKIIYTLLLPIFDQLSKRLETAQLLNLLEKFEKQLSDDAHSAKVRVLLAVIYDDLLMPSKSKDNLKPVLKLYFSQKLEKIESYELFCLIMDKVFSCSLGLKKWVGNAFVRKFSKVKDHYSTNTHFSLSKIATLEFLIHMFEQDEDMSIPLKNYFIEFEHTIKNNLFKILRKWEVV
ncbi:MAG: hypothetical protein KC646_02210 [Candidatus Cloacimonetes bacterium]|nr:hypothetical protein [Candidatus Cloacimonadota bacterium]